MRDFREGGELHQLRPLRQNSRSQPGSLLEAQAPGPGSDAPGPALSLGSITPKLLDAVIRLVCLLAIPRDIPILAPLAEREILYRLLLGDQASKLR